MTIREAVYAVLSQDPQIAAFGEIYNIEAVDNPDRSAPFLVTAWLSTPITSWGSARQRDLLVWAHDRSEDYALIDATLLRAQKLLVGMVHQGGISQVRFTGLSGDLYDDGFHTITRNAGFRVIGTDDEEEDDT